MKAIKPRSQLFSDQLKEKNETNLNLHHILDEIIPKEWKCVNEVKELTGGNCNKVYKVNNQTLKIARGSYRMAELKNEFEIINYLNRVVNFVPKIFKFHEHSQYAYFIENYIEGKLFKDYQDPSERFELFKKLGFTLSQIHQLLIEENRSSEWLVEQLKLAEFNKNNHALDPNEFTEMTVDDTLNWLYKNKPKNGSICLLHGDFRPKNVIVDNDNELKVIDWAFCDIGNPYYDLAILDYYFRNDDERNCFYNSYKLFPYDQALIQYYDHLSKFINI